MCVHMQLGWKYVYAGMDLVAYKAGDTRGIYSDQLRYYDMTIISSVWIDKYKLMLWKENIIFLFRKKMNLQDIKT